MTNPLEALPLEIAQQIDELCDRFEDGWSADHHFQIEQFLREVSPEVQPVLLAALLPIELELLEKEGQQPDIESYRSRFPQFADAIAAVVADANEEGRSNTYQTGAAETFISNPGTGDSPPEPAEASTPTIMRGNVDSQTSIQPVAAGQKSASIIEDEFGRYKIKKTLGQGAMGAVYLAHDTQLDRQVALKIPKFTDDPNGEMLERFYREARSAAMLRSPNICPVFDVGEINGQHYISMAFIAGRTLKDFTKSKKRHSEKQIAVTIRKLAVGLGEAHAHGVVHRDLKPANIMIDGKGEPVVMDFGLARRNASSEVEVTQTGAILGTPAYMSPEQVEGEQSEIGPQSDIYSLGVIMYELITGQMPFQGTLMKILKQIAVDEPQPPSELRDDVDPTIETICLKMMAKDLTARYQSMEEVARDLAAYLKKPREKKKAGVDKPAVEEPAGESVAVGEASNPVLKTASPQVKQSAKPAAVKKQGKSSTPPQTRLLGRFDIARYRNVLITVSAVAACGLLYGAITLFLRVGEVDVKVVIDDPSISVHFDEGGVVRFEGSGKPIRLSPGEQKFVIKRDGLTAKTDEFQVKKDGKNILHVTLVNGEVAVVRNGERPAADKRSIGDSKSSPVASSSFNAPPLAVAPFDEAQAKAHQKAWADYLGVPVEKEVALPGGAKMSFMLIPPGEFMMGTTFDELAKLYPAKEAKDHTPFQGPQHRVRITKPFWLSKHELTVAQFRQFADAAKYKTDAERNPQGGRGLIGRRLTQDPRFNWNKGPGIPQTGNHPVSNVSWNDAMACCRWLSQQHSDLKFTLPTEAQWEFACRAGTEVNWHCGEDAEVLREFAWYSLNSGSKPHLVGQLKANAFGLHDMHGNANEWCADWYSIQYYSNSPTDDPPGPGRGTERSRRGGSWFHIGNNTTSTARSHYAPNYSDFSLGFRVAMTIDMAKLKTVTNGPKPRNDYDEIATGKWIDVFEDHLPRNDNRGEKVKFKDGVLELDNTTVSFPKIEGRNMIIRARVKNLMPEERQLVSLRGQFGKGTYSAGMSNSKGSSIFGWIDNKTHDLKTMRSDRAAIAADKEGFVEMAFAAIDDRLSLYVNGKKRLETTDATLAEGHPGVGYANGHALFKDVQVMLLDSTQRKTTRTPPAASIAPFDEAQAKTHQKAWADYLGLTIEKEVALPGGATMKLVLIPPGEFMMGSAAEDLAKLLEEAKAANDTFAAEKIPHEGPQHRVRITRPFYLGKYEVTQAQWQSVMGTNPSRFKENPSLPVTNVCLSDIAPFLAKVNESSSVENMTFALPSEAQWEYGCRAGTTKRVFTSESEDDLRGYAWCNANSEGKIRPVGELKRNAFGLFDVLGNVSEWCADRFDENYYAKSPVDDPSARTKSSVVIRGGAFRTPPRRCRPAIRSSGAAAWRGRLDSCGFRMSASIDVAKSATFPASVPSNTETRTETDPDRVAAEWVLGTAGGEVTIESGTITKAADLPSKPFQIRGIRLSNIGTVSVDDFARLQGLQHIEKLWIHNVHVGNDVMPHLIPLKTLTELSLSQCQLTDRSIPEIAKLQNLVHLRIGGNEITNAGLESLKPLSPLKDLWLNHTKITDDGLIHLSGLSQLRSLHIHANDLTDDGLAHLLRLKNLRTLGLDFTKVTADGAAELRKTLPECKVYFGTPK